jgi:urea transport system permease protein
MRHRRTKPAALGAAGPKAESLAPLRAAIDSETDPRLKAQKTRLERLLTLRFDPDKAARIAAISGFGAGFGADLGLDLRGALSPPWAPPPASPPPASPPWAMPPARTSPAP